MTRCATRASPERPNTERPMPAILADEHNHFPGLSRIGALLADPGRAAMLWALMDGSARPAGELTMIAGLSPSAASAHLARLTDGGLLALEVRGRHRYFRIASADIAASIEAPFSEASRSAWPGRRHCAPRLRVPRADCSADRPRHATRLMQRKAGVRAFRRRPASGRSAPRRSAARQSPARPPRRRRRARFRAARVPRRSARSRPSQSRSDRRDGSR